MDPDPVGRPPVAELEPFRVEVPEEVLVDLHARLAHPRWPDQPDGVTWELGTDLGYLQDLVATWRDGFDWRAAEARLNTWDQVVTEVEGQRLHAVHARSPEPDAVPLVLVHGWPSTAFEFHKVVEPLRDPVAHGGDAADAFHVVCPSLPGYGFSGPTHELGWTPRRMADAIAVLVDRLGYDRIGLQGGDWGSMVTSQLAAHHPDRVVGLHLNMVVARKPPDDELLDGVSEEELADLGQMQAQGRDFTGYQAIQGTRPQSLAYGLTDSPVGLAGWLVEKYRAWSDCDGDVESAFTRDELLTQITTYWATETINSANRLYREAFLDPASSLPERVEVPMGHARFPEEGFRFPRAWIERLYPGLCHWTDLPRGGHFAAMEQPELLVEDVRRFFRPLR